jgi:hypothetical protein
MLHVGVGYNRGQRGTHCNPILLIVERAVIEEVCGCQDMSEEINCLLLELCW